MWVCSRRVYFSHEVKCRQEQFLKQDFREFVRVGLVTSSCDADNANLPYYGGGSLSDGSVSGEICEKRFMPEIREGDQLLVWLPDCETFAAAIGIGRSEDGSGFLLQVLEHHDDSVEDPKCPSIATISMAAVECGATELWTKETKYGIPSMHATERSRNGTTDTNATNVSAQSIFVARDSCSAIRISTAGVVQ